MRRIAIGMVVGLATWLGSGLVAMAQTPTIQPSGPSCVHVGDSSANLTATINLVTPSACYVYYSVLNGTTPVDPGASYFVPKQGTTINFSHSIPTALWNMHVGDTMHIVVRLKVGITFYPATYGGPAPNLPNDSCAVLGTRPTKSTTVEKKPGRLAMEAIDRDRRREA